MIKEYKATTIPTIFPTACPIAGQFVVIWEYDHKIWSGIYMRIGNSLYTYSQSDNDFTMVEAGSSYPWLGADTTTAKFYVQSED